MIKQTVLGLAILVFSLISCNSNSGKNYDTRAIASLDSLSEKIGELNSCSYTLNVIRYDAEKVDKIFTESDIYMRGPDKMLIYSRGTNDKKAYWYDGNQMAFFSYLKNTYDTIPAPNNIIAAIEEVHEKYGVDFPASDFFYPTLTDDIIDNYEKVLYAEKQTENNITYTIIDAYNDVENLEIWIDSKSKLPYRMIIRKTGASDNYYEATFSNWRLNPKLPDALFEFSPPSGSKRKKINQTTK